jgi:anti-anti-sigma regulatory factor
MQRVEMHDRTRDRAAVSGSVTLSGDMDILSLAELEHSFAALAGARVVIDVHDVRMISAAFIGALVRLRWRLPESRIDVVGANQSVRRTFRAVGADILVRMV